MPTLPPAEIEYLKDASLFALLAVCFSTDGIRGKYDNADQLGLYAWKIAEEMNAIRKARGY